jgi:hypothetical protein
MWAAAAVTILALAAAARIGRHQQTNGPSDASASRHGTATPPTAVPALRR